MSTKKTMHLEVSERTCDVGCRRDVTLWADGESDRTLISYEIMDKCGPLVAMDGLVQGTIFYAMRKGLPLRVHGPMTALGLYNLIEFQSAWALWQPKRYQQIEIIPDVVTAAVPSARSKTIQAFLGGLDATYTLLRNKRLLAGRGATISVPF